MESLNAKPIDEKNPENAQQSTNNLQGSAIVSGDLAFVDPGDKVQPKVLKSSSIICPVGKIKVGNTCMCPSFSTNIGGTCH